MNPNVRKRLTLKTRHRRIRRRATGDSERPRLCVSRSLRNIEAQIVDDVAGRSILGVSSLSKEIRELLAQVQGKCEKSKIVGRLLGEKAIRAGIKRVIFDRGGHRYHGRVKALAEGAREAGLEF